MRRADTIAWIGAFLIALAAHGAFLISFQSRSSEILIKGSSLSVEFGNFLDSGAGDAEGVSDTSLDQDAAGDPLPTDDIADAVADTSENTATENEALKDSSVADVTTAETETTPREMIQEPETVPDDVSDIEAVTEPANISNDEAVDDLADDPLADSVAVDQSETVPEPIAQAPTEVSEPKVSDVHTPSAPLPESKVPPSAGTPPEPSISSPEAVSAVPPATRPAASAVSSDKPPSQGTQSALSSESPAASSGGEAETQTTGQLDAGRDIGGQETRDNLETFGNAETETYRGLVIKHLFSKRPPRAKRPGSAIVSFMINPDGKLESVQIAEGSGSGKFDRDAVKFVQNAEPFPPPPPGVNRNFMLEIKGQ